MALATLSIDVEARLARLEEGLDRASRIVQRSSSDMQKRFDAINASAVALSRTLLTGFAVAGLALFTREALRGLDALNDFKDATGSSIENASALEDVAARTGTSFDTATAAVVRLNKVLSDAKPGSAQANILKSIGLSAEELRKADPVDALQSVATALNGYADDGNKARLVQELFGKSVREVAPLLKDLAENGKRNATVTTEQAEQADKLNKQLFTLQKNLTDLSRVLTALPISKINEAFTRIDSASKVFGSFGQAVAANLGEKTFVNAAEGAAYFSKELGEVQKKLADINSGKAPANALFGTDRVGPLQERQQQLLKLVEFYRNVAFESSFGGDRAGGGRGFVNPGDRPSAPGIADATPKAKRDKFPEIEAAQDRTIQAVLGDLGGTEFARITELQEKLAKLLEIRDQFGAGGGIDELIAEYTLQLEQMSPAAQAAADAQKRLNDLLAETPASKLEATRRDMEFLADAFERGQISVEQFTEAAQARLGTLPETLKQATDEMEEFSKQAARNIQDALGSGVRQVLSGEFDSIGNLFKNMLLDIAAQAISANIGRTLLGNYGKTGEVGGWLQAAMALFSARGNVFAAGGVQAFASGGVFGAPTAFAFGNGRLGVMGEAGPEAVVPLKRGRDGKLGVAGGGTSLSQTYYIGQGVQMGQVVSAVQQGNRELLEQLRAAGRL